MGQKGVLWTITTCTSDIIIIKIVIVCVLVTNFGYWDVGVMI